MKEFLMAYLLLLLAATSVHGDIIFFKDGMKTICREKAWEDGDQIKCEYDGWVLTYPKIDVLRIGKTHTPKDVAPSTEKSHAHESESHEGMSEAKKASNSSAIDFYNPRRPEKYWTDKNTGYKSYQDAIEALANQYHRSAEWIQAHMGNTNDLEQIHHNLQQSVSDPQTMVSIPTAVKIPGIVFYNPRRPYPYWTGKAAKHKSYNEAIRSLADKYGKSVKWVQENMGDSNDLNEIHENLKNAD